MKVTAIVLSPLGTSTVTRLPRSGPSTRTHTGESVVDSSSWWAQAVNENARAAPSSEARINKEGLLGGDHCLYKRRAGGFLMQGREPSMSAVACQRTSQCARAPT